MVHTSSREVQSSTWYGEEQEEWYGWYGGMVAYLQLQLIDTRPEGRVRLDANRCALHSSSGPCRCDVCRRCKRGGDNGYVLGDRRVERKQGNKETGKQGNREHTTNLNPTSQGGELVIRAGEEGLRSATAHLPGLDQAHAQLPE
jgi:hypothetical protein